MIPPVLVARRAEQHRLVSRLRVRAWEVDRQSPLDRPVDRSEREMADHTFAFDFRCIDKTREVDWANFDHFFDSIISANLSQFHLIARCLLFGFQSMVPLLILSSPSFSPSR